MTEQPINQPRRKDREMTDPEWIKAFLHRAPFAVIATATDGQPFAHSNLFVYDEPRNAIYFHTALAGRTRSNIEANDRVCFSISEMGRLLPADTALQVSVEYNGVAVFGRACIVTDTEEATHGLQLLLDKYFPHLHPGKEYRPIQPEELAATLVLRIDIDCWSGKRKVVADDFPGAFYYGEKSA